MTQPDWSVEPVGRRRDPRRVIAWLAVLAATALGALLIAAGDGQRKNTAADVSSAATIPAGTVVITVESLPEAPPVSIDLTVTSPRPVVDTSPETIVTSQETVGPVETTPVETGSEISIAEPVSTPAPTASTTAPPVTTSVSVTAPPTNPSATDPVGSSDPTASVIAGPPESTLPGGQEWPNGFVDGSVLFLRGVVPSEAVGDDLVERAVRLLGEDNVRNELVIDPSAPTVETVVVRFSDSILFAEDSAAIPASYNARFALWAHFLEDNPDVEIGIIGHSDARGSLAHNIKLSELRALAARQRIVLLGGDPSRVETRAAGPTEPIADNSTEQGRAHNRRIEFTVSGLFS